MFDTSIALGSSEPITTKSRGGDIAAASTSDERVRSDGFADYEGYEGNSSM